MHYDFGIRDVAKYASPTHSIEVSLSLIGNYDNEDLSVQHFKAHTL